MTDNNSWLHGVEHLTKDWEGYVYWKGGHVEHYSFRDKEAERIAAIKLGQICKQIETMGKVPNGQLVLNMFEPGTEEWYTFNLKDCKAPKNLQAVAIVICKKFNINGLCDAPYIANVLNNVLFEDSESEFRLIAPKDLFSKALSPELIKKAANRLMDSYRSCGVDSGVIQIIAEHLERAK